MKLIRTLSLSLALAASVSTAYADDAKKPAPAPKAEPAPANKADIDKFLAFFDKIVDAVVKNSADCPKMASELNKLIDANQEILKTAAEEQAKGMQLPKDAQDHMMAQAKKMMGAAQKCGNDKDVQAALQRMAPQKKK